ncbi:MAG TPA: response regulator transcription factor [Clostridiaceae bacterium]|nr:response regulator transcription factor [Clostridiaceae bacterium]
MRLLLAEDEVDLTNALVVILKHNNYSVDAVHNGLEALDYLTAGNYDAAIIDIMMPRLDGISVVKRLRAAGNNIPILLLTARSEIEDRVIGLDSGADDYLTKPFSSRELLARIRALSRRQADVSNPILSCGNIFLNRSTYELKSAKKSLKLANKEFQIMEMLLLNPGQLISLEQFMEKIWGYDTEVETNVVWVNISNLRKKLRAISADVSIKATRNVGYALEVLE